MLKPYAFARDDIRSIDMILWTQAILKQNTICLFPLLLLIWVAIGDTRTRNRNGKRYNVYTACTSLCAMQTQSKTWFPSEGLTSPGLHVKPWREITSPDYRAK